MSHQQPSRKYPKAILATNGEASEYQIIRTSISQKFNPTQSISVVSKITARDIGEADLVDKMLEACEKSP